MNVFPRPLLSIALALLVSLLGLAAGCQNDPAPPNADSSATAESPAPPTPSSAAVPPPRSVVPAPPPAAEAPIPNPATTPGQGSPTEFQSNRPAVLHFGGQTMAIPGTLWFAAAVAPDGETPFSFRSNSEGLYLFTFRGRTPCTFTDAAGTPLPLVGATLGLDTEANGATRTVFKLLFSGK